MTAKDTKSSTGVDRRIGAMIRSRRLALEMTQTQLGEALGVTFQQIQKYEKGVNRISAARLQDIAQTLKADVSEFYDGSGEKMDLSSPEESELLRAFRSISDAKVRRSIVKLLQSIAG